MKNADCVSPGSHSSRHYFMLLLDERGSRRRGEERSGDVRARYYPPCENSAGRARQQGKHYRRLRNFPRHRARGKPPPAEWDEGVRETETERGGALGGVRMKEQRGMLSRRIVVCSLSLFHLSRQLPSFGFHLLYGREKAERVAARGRDGTWPVSQEEHAGSAYVTNPCPLNPELNAHTLSLSLSRPLFVKRRVIRSPVNRVNRFPASGEARG